MKKLLYQSMSLLLSFLILFTSTPIAFAASNTTNDVNWGSPGSLKVESSAEWTNNTKTEALIKIGLNTTSYMKGGQVSHDFYFLTDTSSSLFNERLENTKSALKNVGQNILGSYPGNKLSLISFGRKANLETESPVADIGSFTSKVDAISTNSSDKANYSSAINLALTDIKKNNSTNPIIILLTASQNSMDSVWEIEDVVNKADELGAKIYTVQYMSGKTSSANINALGSFVFYGTTLNSISSALSESVNTAMSVESFRNITTNLTLNPAFEVDATTLKATRGTVSESSGNVSWNISDLVSGSSTELTFRIKLKSGQQNGTIKIFDNASLTYSAPAGGNQNVTITSPDLNRSIYKVSYSIGSASGNVPVDANSYYAGEVVFTKEAHLFDTSGNGYVFSGWKVKETNEIVTDSFVMPDSNVTLEPIWGKADVLMGTGTVYVAPTMPKIELKTIIPNYQNITEAEFIDAAKGTPTGATKIQISNDNGKPINAYIVGTKLYIGASGGIIANFDQSGLFADFSNMTKIAGGQYFDTSKCLSFDNMFLNCIKLSDISTLSNWDVSQVQFMQSMFGTSSASIKNTALKDISALANWHPKSLRFTNIMFSGCTGLTNVDALASWGTEVKLEDMSGMFQLCEGLQNVNGLTSWNVSEVSNFSYLFSGCKSLSNISGLANWNVSKMTNANAMFAENTSLGNIDALTNWRPNKLTVMDRMFYQNTQLTSVSGMKNWGAIPTSLSGMLINCTMLQSLDGLQGLNVSNVTNFGLVTEVTDTNVSMDSIFFGCNNVTNVDAIKNWNVNKGTSFAGMFAVLPKVTTVDISTWNISSSANIDYIIGAFNNIPRTSQLTIYVKDIATKNRLDASNVSGKTGYNDKVTVVVGAAPRMAPRSATIPLNNTGIGNAMPMFYGLTGANSVSKETVTGGLVGENSPILYWIAPMFYGDEGSTSGEMDVVWVLPEGLRLNVDKQFTYALERIKDDGKAKMGTLVNNQVNIDDINGIVSFKVKGLNAGTMLKVNLECITPGLEGKNYREFIANSTVNYMGNTNISNNVVHWIGSEDVVVKKNVSYSYAGDVPPSASSLPSSTQLVIGSNVKVAVNPSASGYIFKGWSTTDAVVSNGSFVMPNKDVNITGTWEKINYEIPPVDEVFSVKYSYTGEFPVSAPVLPDDISVIKGESYSILTNIVDPNGEYVFKGWTSNDLTAQELATGLFTASKNVSLTGSWERKEFKVTYAFIGNNTFGTLPSTQNYKWGTQVSLAGPLSGVPGYTFDGWYKDYDTETPDTFIMPKNDVTIYGAWNEITKTISFEYASPAPAEAVLPQKVNGLITGDVYTLPVPTVSSGETFAGWTVKNLESGATINNNVITMGDSNVTLVGTWGQGKNINVTFKWSGTPPPNAKFPSVPEHVFKGTSFNVGVVVPNGYVFNGWTITPNTTGAKIEENVLTVGSDNIELTGNWGRGTPVQINFEYTGNVPSNPPYPNIPDGKAYQSDVIDLKVNCPDGYRIKSWTIKESDSDSVLTKASEATIDGFKYYLDNSLKVGTKSVTLIANWERKGGNIPLRFFYMGETPDGWPSQIDASFKLAIGEKVLVSPTPPMPTGYTITNVGMESSGGINMEGSPEGMTIAGTSSSSIIAFRYTLARVGTPVNLDFIFSGDVPAGVTPPAFTDPNFHLYEGSTVNVPAYGNVRGFVFKGWTLKSDGTDAVWTKNQNDSGGTVVMGRKNATLVGVWEAVGKVNVSVEYSGQSPVSLPTLPAGPFYPGDTINFLDMSPYETDLYKFKGWSVKDLSSGSSFTGNTLTIGTKDTVVVGTWKGPSEVMVTFEWAGNPPPDLEVPTMTGKVYNGTKIDLPAYGNYGQYKFLGWSVKNQGTGAQLNGNTLIVGDSNVTIVGTWKANSEIGFIFEYSGDIPDGLSLPTFPEGTHIFEGYNVTISTFVPQFYNFKGWSIKPGTGAGANLVNTDLANAKATVTTGSSDITVVGEFELIGTKVSYEYINPPAGVSALPTTRLYNRGEVIEVANNPSLPDYEFSGWKVKSPSGISIVDNKITLSAKEVVLSGTWTRKPSITYQYASGAPANAPSLPNNSSAYVGANVQVAENPVLNKYSFSGWKVKSPVGLNISGGNFTMPNEPVILEGSWTELKKNVSFSLTGAVPSGVKTPESKDGYKNNAIALPVFDKIPGYTFDGWSIQGENYGAYIMDGILYVGDDDITLVGNWNVNGYLMSYQYSGKVPPAAPVLPFPESKLYNEEIIIKENPTMVNYDFSGWKVTSPDNVEVIDGKFKMPASIVIISGEWTPKQNTVTYRYTEGAPSNAPLVPEAKQYNYGTEVSVATNPTMDEYDFSGWSIVEPKDLVLDKDKFVMPTDSVILEGTWTKKQYNLTYTYDGAPDGVPQLPDTKKYAVSEEVALLSIANLENYVFMGWKALSPEGLKITNNKLIMPNEDVILVGEWVNKYATVTYRYVNGTASDVPPVPSASRVEVGTQFTVNSDMSSKNYVFEGWKVVEPAGLELIDNKFTMPPQNVVLEGSWKVAEYTTKYEYSGTIPEGAPAIPTEKVNQVNSEVTIATNPIMEKYDFSGWKVKTPASLSINGGKFNMPAENVVFTGEWTKKQHTVTFTYASGAPTNAPILPNVKSFEVDAEVSVDNTISLPGYTFSGWTVSSPSGVSITDNKFTMPNSNVTLIGTWTINKNAVHYEYSENTPASAPKLPDDKIYSYGDEVSLLQFDGSELNGYTFSDWIVIGPGNVEIVARNNRFTMPDGPVTVKGGWSKGSYTVTYKYDIGHPEDVPVVPVKFLVEANSQVTLANNPTYEGWNFLGWEVKTPSGIVVNSGKFVMPNSNVEIVGKWAKNSYRVTYSYIDAPLNAPSIPSAKDYAYGATVRIETNPKLAGNTFEGWQISDKTIVLNPDGTFKMPSKNVEITGKWLKKTYNVTYKYLTAPETAPKLPDTKAYDYNENVSVFDVGTINNYTFSGWKVISPTNPTISNNTFNMPAGDVVFEGNWLLNQHKVRYEYRGTTPTGVPTIPNEEIYGVGKEVVIKNNPTLKGHTFSGWTTDSSISIDTNKFTMIDSEVVFYGHWDSTPVSYSLEYKMLGDIPSGVTVPNKTTLNFNASVTLPNVPDVEGYTFSGWKLPTSINVTNGTFNMPAENVVVTGEWTKNVHSVIYRYTNTFDGVGDIPATIKYESGKTVTQRADMKSGKYAFSGWKLVSPEGLAIDSKTRDFIMPDSDVIFEGTWTLSNYSVEYQYSGEVPDGASKAPEKALKSPTTTVNIESVPVLDGYTFSGWTISSPKGLSVTDGAFVMPEANVIITGSWTPNSGTKYTVNHFCETSDGVYPDVPTDSKEFLAPTNSTVKSSSKVLSFTNFVLDRFDTEQIVVKNDGSSVINIYYKRDSYSVKYEFIGNRIPQGAVAPSSVTVKGQTSFTLENPQNYDGFKFSGWVAKTPSNLKIEGNTFVMPDENVILNGYWIKDGEAPILPPDGDIVPDIPVKLIFNSNDKNSISYETDYKSGEIITVPRPNNMFPDNGMRFMGWAKNPNTTIITYIAYEQFTMPDADLNLYAVWGSKDDDWGGSTNPDDPDSPEDNYGGSELPWGQEDKPSHGGGSYDDSNSITFYANNYTGNVSVKFYNSSKNITLPNGENMFGHKDLEFVGWAKNKDANSADYKAQEELSTGRTYTLYGIWRKAGYQTKDIIDDKSVNIDVDGDGIPDINLDRNNDGIVDAGSPRTAEEYYSLKDGLLNKSNHFGYINGYSDGTFRPESYIKRSEVAEIFYRLLNDKSYNTTFSYKDVRQDAWYKDAVNKLSELGVIKGYSNGKFGAEDNITRAEFAVIASRFDNLDIKNSHPFKDTVGHWAEKYIESAVNKGWITADANGNFRPNEYITRAEVVSIVNKELKRTPDSEFIDSNNVNTFSDINSTHWAFYDIVEATVSHDYTKNNNEKWTSIK